MVEKNEMNLDKKIITTLHDKSIENSIPIIKDEGLEKLLEIVREKKPRKILEIGTAVGYSSINMAKVSDAIIDTIERKKEMYLEAIKNIKELNLEERIRVHFADGLLIDNNELESDYDIIFIDAAKAQSQKFFEKFSPLLKIDGLIITDNMLFHGMVKEYQETNTVLNKSKDLRALVRKINNYHQFLKNNNEFQTTFLELGDGLAISKRKMENKIITEYNDSLSLELNVKGLIINSSLYSTYNGKVFNYSDILKISKEIKKANKLSIVSIDRIIPQNEIDDFKIYVLKLKKLIDNNLIDYIIYSDYSLLSILGNDYYKYLIYDSKTLVCSAFEVKNIDTKTFISNELSIKEIYNICNNINDLKVSITCFGYLQMFYSRRELLDLVLPKKMNVKSNKVYDLKEEIRDEFYKIYETKRRTNYGTFIYNYAIYVLLNELLPIYNNIFFIRLNSLFLEEIIKDVISFYQDLNHDNEIKLISYLQDKGYKVDRGFLDRESILIKD